MGAGIQGSLFIRASHLHSLFLTDGDLQINQIPRIFFFFCLSILWFSPTPLWVWPSLLHTWTFPLPLFRDYNWSISDFNNASSQQHNIIHIPDCELGSLGSQDQSQYQDQSPLSVQLMSFDEFQRHPISSSLGSDKDPFPEYTPDVGASWRWKQCYCCIHVAYYVENWAYCLCPDFTPQFSISYIRSSAIVYHNQNDISSARKSCDKRITWPDDKTN